MPRVAFVTDSLNAGGAERQLVLLAGALTSHGWGVRVVRYRDGSFFELPDGVEERVLSRRGPMDPRLVIGLSRALRRPDISISHVWKPFAGIYSGLAALGPGRSPQILHLHTGAAALQQAPSLARAYLFAALLCDHVVGVSQDALDWLAECGIPRERLSWIANCVDAEMLRAPRASAAASSALLRRLGLPAGAPPPIVAIGRVDANKNPSGLLRALTRVRAEGRSLPPLLLVGSVGEPEELSRCRRAAAESRIEFHHHEPIHEIATLIDSARLVVLASHAEGLPMVVLEGMARGALVVASGAGEVPRVLLDGETGFVATQVRGRTDDDAMATALGRALDVDERAKARISNAARSEARARFEPSALAGVWVALYDRLLRAPSGPTWADPAAVKRITTVIRQLREPEPFLRIARMNREDRVQSDPFDIPLAD